MKVLTTISMLLTLSLPLMLDAQSAAASATQEAGVTVRDGKPYLVHEGKATRLDETQLPEGQMINGLGEQLPLPAGVTGFAGTTAPAVTPSANATDAGTIDPATTGVTLREGVLYLVRNGTASRIDTATLLSTDMMTLDGRKAPVPENVTGFETMKEPGGSASGGSITPGKVTQGKVTPGRVEGSNVRGSDVRGSDVRGADVSGGNVRGGDVRGGDTSR